MSKFRLHLVVAVGAVLAISAHAQADTITVLTSTSWRSIGPVGNQEGTPINSVGAAWESANPGWNSSLAFDDSNGAGWHGSVTRGSPNVIWSDDPPFFGSTPSYFRTTFVVGGTPTLGLLDLSVDDDAQVWLNGVLVIDDSNTTAGSILDHPVSAYLVSGTNLIAVKAHDSFPFAPLGSNAESLFVRLDVTFNAASASVPLPPSAFMGLGLLGALGGLALRRAHSRRITIHQF